MTTKAKRTPTSPDETVVAAEAAEAPSNGAGDAPSLEEQATVYRMTAVERQQWTAARQHADRVGSQHSRAARQLLEAEERLEAAQSARDAAKEANRRAADKATEADQAFETLTQQLLGELHKPGAKLTITDDGVVIDQLKLFELRRAEQN